MFNIPAPNLCFAQNSFAVSHAVNFPWLKQTLDFENSRKLFSGHLGHTPGCGWRDKFYCGAIKKFRMGCPRFMRIYSVLPNIFGGQSVDQFGLTATAVYRFPSCPAAALPLIFQTQKSIRLFACKTTMQTERLTVLSSPAIPYRFAATSL